MASRVGSDYYTYDSMDVPTDGQGKHCRTCTNFKTWSKAQSGQNSKPDIENISDSVKTNAMRSDCPLDRDQLGSQTWGFLHTMAALYPERPAVQQQNDMTQFFTLFSKFYPCETCAEHFRNQLKDSPPKVESQQSLSHWLCCMHNKINQSIGKPEFDCKLVNERWRDGWLDGSCDY